MEGETFEKIVFMIQLISILIGFARQNDRFRPGRNMQGMPVATNECTVHTWRRLSVCRFRTCRLRI